MSRPKTIKERWINLTTTVNIISNKVTRKWKTAKTFGAYIIDKGVISLM